MVKERKMKKYIIFGCSENLSNLFDIIHANKGKVYKIYQNMPELERERAIGLRERVALLGYDVKVYDSLHPFQPETGCLYAVAPTTPLKYRLIEELKEGYSLTFSALIHPSVILGSNVHIGEGVIIDVQAAIAPNAYLDDFCCILRCSSFGHEAHIGKYSLVSVGVSIGGSTHIGEKCRIGMKATILERLYIGDWTVIGAGSLVNKDMPRGVVAYGVPARVIRENEKVDFERYMRERQKSETSA
jgi:sugar O-acyltransferase (sialic acid O-acetyltransferase NeuD family)